MREKHTFGAAFHALRDFVTAHVSRHQNRSSLRSARCRDAILDAAGRCICRETIAFCRCATAASLRDSRASPLSAGGTLLGAPFGRSLGLR